METRFMKRAKNTRVETRAMKLAKSNEGEATSVGAKPSRSVKPRKERKPTVKVTVTVDQGCVNFMCLGRWSKSAPAQRDSTEAIYGLDQRETKKEITSFLSERVVDMDKFVCDICVEKKMMNEAFKIKGCTHFFCSECMARYVASKIQENVTSIGCPEMNCEGVLEPELCQSILPQEVFDLWGKALCEALIPEPQKCYCPYKDCSALLINECGEGISESECPHCKRPFCVQCKVPWHAEIICDEFQKLSADERGAEDILLVKAVTENKWKRCPGCKFYVEKRGGCKCMRCRCGHVFCYRCGSTVKNSYCAACKRERVY